ncbi:MAG: DUF2188 domain-containing protein [Saprospiraceae bacterium]|nr:DUF2188 domain-containing protein [Saprospiraceae bacterium]
MPDQHNRIHIIKRDDGWVLRKDGATKASKKFPTKQDALESAYDLRSSYDLVVHSPDGTVENYWEKGQY